MEATDLDITPQDMVQMMLGYIHELDEAQILLEKALHAEATAERDYRRARAGAWDKLTHAEGVPPLARAREDWIDANTSEARFKRDNCTGQAKSRMENVRNKRQQLSAVQSAANSIKEEAALYRVGQHEQ